MFDLPGTGMSDPVSLAALPTLEQWADHVVAVLDAAGAPKAVLLASDSAAPVALLVAARHPQRVEALVLYGAFATLYRDDDYAPGIPRDGREEGLRWWVERWGSGRQLEVTAPELAYDPHEREPIARIERFSASPGVARALFRMISELDVRDVLPSVHVPTLVVHRSGDRWIHVDHGRYLADRIEDARYVELPGTAHYLVHGDTDAVIAAIRQFLDALPADATAGVLATVLVTMASTEKAAAVGDERWRALLDRHDALVREQVARFGGRTVRSTGDGVLAVFDGAARAVRCAAAVRDACARSGSASVPALAAADGGAPGRRRRRDGRPHIAARIAALAGSTSCFVSQTVKDLTVGAQLRFDRRHGHVAGRDPEGRAGKLERVPRHALESRSCRSRERERRRSSAECRCSPNARAASSRRSRPSRTSCWCSGRGRVVESAGRREWDRHPQRRGGRLPAGTRDPRRFAEFGSASCMASSVRGTRRDGGDEHRPGSAASAWSASSARRRRSR